MYYLFISNTCEGGGVDREERERERVLSIENETTQDIAQFCRSTVAQLKSGEGVKASASDDVVITGHHLLEIEIAFDLLQDTLVGFIAVHVSQCAQQRCHIVIV
jgi:hypothetical protein